VWDEKLPPAENLKRVGLNFNVNGEFGRKSTKKGPKLVAETLQEVTFAEIPASDSLDVDRNPRRRPMSEVRTLSIHAKATELLRP